VATLWTYGVGNLEKGGHPMDIRGWQPSPRGPGLSGAMSGGPTAVYAKSTVVDSKQTAVCTRSTAVYSSSAAVDASCTVVDAVGSR